MTVAPVAKKTIAVATVTAVALTYKRISDGTAYTPQVGDGLVAILNGTKAAAGNSTITLPAGWILAASGGISNGGVNDTAAIIVRIADGSSADLPTVAVTSAAWQAKTYAYPAGVFEPSRFPWDPAALPQAPQTAVAASSNAGVPLATTAPDVEVLSALCLRGPAATATVVWSGTTVDDGLAGGSNNFLSTARSIVTAPTSVRPSATWSGGSGTASALMSISIAPPGSIAGTTLNTRVAGVQTPAPPKIRTAGAPTPATWKVRTGGAFV